MIRFIRVLVATMMLALVVSPSAPIMAAAPLVVTIKTNETFARSLTVSIPSANFPLLGSFALSLKHSPSDVSPAHSFSTGTGNIRVISTDNANKKAMLALLMSQQDAATLAGNYQGDLTYTDGARVINIGRFVFQVIAGVTSVTPADPPAYDNLAAWSPITDIFGTSDPTVVTVPGQPLAAVAVNDLWTSLYGFVGSSSGSSAPTNGPGGAPLPYQWWMDTSGAPNRLRMFDGSQWPIFATFDISAHQWSVDPSAIPTPTTIARGGVYTISPPAHHYLSGLSNTGSFIFARPETADLSDLGAGASAALGTNVGSVGSFVVNGGALGTPASGTLTNATGLPIATGVSGLGSGVAAALAAAKNTANGFATFGAVQAIAANNTTLSSYPSTYAEAVVRLGYSSLGDSEPLVFLRSNSACSRGAGSGDGVTQFPSADGTCWLAQISSSVWDAAWGGLDTGSYTNSVKLQAMIDALPDRGGTIKINQCGFYNFASTVHIGNGTSTVTSTRRGVHIVGNGDVMLTQDPAAPFPCVQFTWTGAFGAGPVISYDGPMNGWGLQNIYFYGANSGSGAFKLHATSDGYLRNVVANGFIGRSVLFDTYPSSGYPNHTVYNTGRNIIDNLYITTADYNGAIGLLLDGPADGLTDPCLNTFTNLSVAVGTITPGNVGVGIYLAVADTNLFINPHVFGAYSAVSYGVLLDYTKNNIYPTANSFVGGSFAKDPGMLGKPIGSIGSPYYTSAPNYLNGMQQVNGATISPNVTGISTDLPRIEFPTLSASNRNNKQDGILFKASVTSLYRICDYMTTQVAGSAGTASFSMTWNDGIDHAFTSANPLSLTSTANTAADCRVILVNGGAEVNWGIDLAGVVGSPAFGYYITTERLD